MASHHHDRRRPGFRAGCVRYAAGGLNPRTCWEVLPLQSSAKRAARVQRSLPHLTQRKNTFEDRELRESNSSRHDANARPWNQCDASPTVVGSPV
jgi:hypothetical protein